MLGKSISFLLLKRLGGKNCFVRRDFWFLIWMIWGFRLFYYGRGFQFLYNLVKFSLPTTLNLFQLRYILVSKSLMQISFKRINSSSLSNLDIFNSFLKLFFPIQSQVYILEERRREVIKI